MGGWRCPSCDSGNAAGTRFCGHCGDGRPDDHALWTCGTCSAANAEESRYCGHCGTRHTTTPQIEERREVTALFADISGFTTLADQVEDAEALHDIINPVIAGMAAIAERYDGFVAKYAGDALLVFFGAPVAHEDDAARALHVALEMHSALPELLTTLPSAAHALTLHIGVNTGRVISGQFGGDLRNDYSILGDSVILAQRLESVAPSGSTFVGQRTRDLVADQFRFAWMGELDLKGKVAAVPAWRLVGVREGPAAGAAGGQLGPLVGRGAELALVDATIASLTEGRGGGTVTVTGEPGVGKTRLLQEARARAESAGLQWVQVRIPSFGESLTYWPFAEIARAVAGIRVDHDVEEARRRLAAAPGIDEDVLPLLARLLGIGRAEELTGLDPEEARRRLHHGVVDWLLRLGDERATVFAIEDVHWIDRASADLAGELARATQGWPVALVLTARPEGLDDLERISVAVDEAFRARFDVGPLTHDGIVELLTALLEGEPPEKLITVAEARSGGNPLFVTELVRTLLDEQTLSHGAGGWRMRPGWTETTIPDTVERLLASRIDLLEPEPASVLGAASVVGRLVRLPLLRAIADIEGIDHHLDGLVQAGFLDPTFDDQDTAFLFHHALVQEVAYSRLLRRRRAELHRTLAENAEQVYGTGDDVVELLARHSYLGERGSVATGYCARAGRRAASLYANDEAIGHLERAVELAADRSDGDGVDDLRVELGNLRELVGDYEAALEDYRAAGSVPGAVAGEADVLRKLGRYTEAEEQLRAEIERLGPESPAAAPLWYRLGRTLSMHSAMHEAIPSLRRAVELARRDDPTIPDALIVLSALCAAEGSNEDALQYALFARRIFDARDDLRGLGAAYRAMGDAYGCLERFDEGAAALQQGVELAQRVGEVEHAAIALINLGLLELERGDAETAVTCDRRAAAEFAHIGHGPGQAIAHGNLAEKLVHLGDLEGAEEACTVAASRAEEIGLRECLADLLVTRALIREQQGRLDEAVDLAREAERQLTDLGVLASAARAGEVADRATAALSTS